MNAEIDLQKFKTKYNPQDKVWRVIQDDLGVKWIPSQHTVEKVVFIAHKFVTTYEYNIDGLPYWIHRNYMEDELKASEAEAQEECDWRNDRRLARREYANG
jgi:hypothetical protein